MFWNAIKRSCMIALGGVVLLVELLFAIITVLFGAISTVFANLSIGASQIVSALYVILNTLCEKAKGYLQ